MLRVPDIVFTLRNGKFKVVRTWWRGKFSPELYRFKRKDVGVV